MMLGQRSFRQPNGRKRERSTQALLGIAESSAVCDLITQPVPLSVHTCAVAPKML
jgi:hypothetical protein